MGWGRCSQPCGAYTCVACSCHRIAPVLHGAGCPARCIERIMPCQGSVKAPKGCVSDLLRTALSQRCVLGLMEIREINAKARKGEGAKGERGTRWALGARMARKGGKGGKVRKGARGPMGFWGESWGGANTPHGWGHCTTGGAGRPVSCQLVDVAGAVVRLGPGRALGFSIRAGGGRCTPFGQCDAEHGTLVDPMQQDRTSL
jgi:hypothetical protein